jgi:phospholipid/cholesterol/gamma-HCH transport system substrate-binding protein
VRFGRTAILLQLLGAIAFVVYLLGHEGVQFPFTGSGDYTVQAQFTDAGGLSGADATPVLVSGVPEGRVTAVTYRHGLAVATLRLPDAVRGEIHADATATVIPRSVALEDLTVDINPGDPRLPALRPGATIPPSRTSASVRFDSLIDVLDANTRAQLQIMLSQLQSGIGNRAGALRGALAQLGNLVTPTSVVTTELADRRVLLSRLVSTLATMVDTLGARSRDLAGAVADGSQTLAVTAAVSDRLAATMRELPAALESLTGAMNAVNGLSKPLAPALTELPPLARALPSALASLRRFDPSGVRLIADLRTLIARGSGPAADLRTTLTRLGPASRALAPTAHDLLPVLQVINTHKQGIGEVGDNFSGVFSTNDANGPILRGLGFFEPLNPVDMGFPGTSAASLRAAQTDSIRALTDVCRHSNPLACIIRYLVPGLPGSVVPSSLVPRLVGGGG